MTEAQLHRDIASLQVQVRVLESQMSEQNKLLAEIRTTLSEARGGWRALVWLGGAGAALGAAAGSVVTWFARNGGAG